jgi:hypothetical protein
MSEPRYDNFSALLPLAVSWVAESEASILREGVPLSSVMLGHARVIGVRHPEAVRVLAVDEIPLPEHPALRRVMQEGAMPVGPGKGGGMCLRYGIYLHRDSASDERLLVHELVHTMQYERQGGIEPFVVEYVSQIAGGNYHNAPLEVEARALAMRVCP